MKIRSMFLTTAALAVALTSGLVTTTAPASAATVVPARAAATDVGVIPASRTCPLGAEAVVIRMDDEDRNNNNGRSGSIGAIQSDSNTEFFFCRVDGTRLRALQPDGGQVKPYAVLKLGATCPNGSEQFTRRFDNEDTNNRNRSEGSIAPNVSDSNTTLVFCLFARGVERMTAFPNLGFSYHVFSSVDSSGWFRTDDEDRNNNNQYTADPAIRSIAQAIVSGGANTTLRVRNAR